MSTLKRQESKMPEEPPPAEPAPEGEAPPEEEAEPELPPPCMDLTGFPLKIDVFDAMHMLDEKQEKIDGAPNFRQVAGFPIFASGQPTEEGFLKVLDKTKVGDDTPPRAIWFNMRKEPVIYVNGNPCTPRYPDDLHRNLEVQFPVDELENLQTHYLKYLCGLRDEDANQSIKIHKDGAFAENPMEREDIEETVKVESIKELKDIYENLKENGYPNLIGQRCPVNEDRAPGEECFDIMIELLKNEPASTPCIFSDQMGRGRTTLGMIIACLIKEIQITTELRRMEDIDLVAKDTVDDLIHQKFESALPKCQDDDDPFIKGEFDVIKELLEKVPATKEGKKKIDRVIDICGPPPKGTGLQNLRECVIETKWKYDVATEDKQVAWKHLILSFMERYFYLICFATYAMEYGPGGYQKTFVSWMDENKDLRQMIEEGKDKLEWYRTVDPQKLEHLKELISAPNYKENLGVLIRTIYDFAFVTYADLPRGPIKNNSMRRLAATTLMDILPTEIAERVNKKMEEDPSSTHDFLTLVGLVSYYGSDE